MPTSKQTPSRIDARQSKLPLGVLIALIVVLFCLVFSQTWFNLTFLRPDNTQQTLVFTALSFLISLLFVALLSILLSQLVRLYIRRRIMGSRFQTKMVVGALFLSFVPVLFLFIFAYGLMSRSIDKWFSYPAEQLRKDSDELASLLTGYAASNANAEAAAIASAPETQHAFATSRSGELLTEVKRHGAILQGGFVVALKDDNVIASYRAPLPWSQYKDQLAPAASGQQPHIARINNIDYVIGDAAEGADGHIIVALPLPESLNALMSRIRENQRRYSELSSNRRQVRQMYVKLLALITLLTLFLATWISVYISKFVTRSVSALAEAMEEISQGHFSYRVELETSDELGELVTSFNSMAADLENSRVQLDASGQQLEEARQSREERRRQLEAVLENIPSGVLSLDATYRITDFNRAFANTFAQRKARSNSNEDRPNELSDFFDSDLVLDLRRLLRKSDRMGVTAGQFEVTNHDSTLDVAVTAASLHSGKQRLGYVVVFEDFTELLKAQKQAAWREVARRVAHEIKNPLTPIALSAERIRNHIEKASTPSRQSLTIIRTCIETITGSVETVRNLVNQFATLAQFPTSQPQPANINVIVESALAMFQDRLEGIRIHLKLAPELPAVMADPEAMKRALANLIDNAAEAISESLYREIEISTAAIEGRDAIEIVIADSGHGVTHEMKEKLFLPYFSTKQRGTGLGLAIVSKILQEHQGSIRVEENQPVGTRFILELPLAAESAPTQIQAEAAH